MRIVAGALRGRSLDAPPGAETRPTSERAREALFNILGHWERPLSGARIADIFAGSGALGFEALSRGALRAVFVEQAPNALAALRGNARKLGVEGACSILAIDARHLPPAERPFDFLFMDPPYRSGLASEILPALVRKGWVDENSLIVIEAAKNEQFDPPEDFTLIDQRKYGAARLFLIRRQQTEA